LQGVVTKVAQEKSGKVTAYMMSEEDKGLIEDANVEITRLLERFWVKLPMPLLHVD